MSLLSLRNDICREKWKAHHEEGVDDMEAEVCEHGEGSKDEKGQQGDTDDVAGGASGIHEESAADHGREKKRCRVPREDSAASEAPDDSDRAASENGRARLQKGAGQAEGRARPHEPLRDPCGDTAASPNRCAFFSSFFYAILRNAKSGYTYENVRRWSRKKVRSYLLPVCITFARSVYLILSAVSVPLFSLTSSLACNLYRSSTRWT